jgi:hypothetical protein
MGDKLVNEKTGEVFTLPVAPGGAVVIPAGTYKPYAVSPEKTERR